MKRMRMTTFCTTQASKASLNFEYFSLLREASVEKHAGRKKLKVS